MNPQKPLLGVLPVSIFLCRRIRDVSIAIKNKTDFYLSGASPCTTKDVDLLRKWAEELTDRLRELGYEYEEEDVK